MTSTMWIAIGAVLCAVAAATLIVSQLMLHQWIQRYDNENQREE